MLLPTPGRLPLPRPGLPHAEGSRTGLQITLFRREGKVGRARKRVFWREGSLPRGWKRVFRGVSTLPTLWKRVFRGGSTLPTLWKRVFQGVSTLPTPWKRVFQGVSTLPTLWKRVFQGRRTLPWLQKTLFSITGRRVYRRKILVFRGLVAEGLSERRADTPVRRLGAVRPQKRTGVSALPSKSASPCLPISRSPSRHAHAS